MSFSTNKKTLNLRISEAAFCVRDVLPFLAQYTLNDLLATSWCMLCKFNDATLARWARALLEQGQRIPDPAAKAAMARRINAFVDGNQATTGLRPVHIAIGAHNTHMLELILDFTGGAAPVAEFTINKRTGLMSEREVGTESQSNKDDAAFHLVDCAVLSGDPEILKVLIRRNLASP